MARPKQNRQPKKTKSKPALNQLAPGMPSLDNVVKVVHFISPQKGEHDIIETTEMDSYDPIPRTQPRKRKPK